VIPTSDQQNALDAIAAFMRDPNATAFLLEGGAGCGKTASLGQVLKTYNRGLRCCAAPTHKALNVLRSKLRTFDVPWCRGYDSFSYNGSDTITGTTAALLGIVPTVDDDQNTEEVKFAKAGKGLLSKIMPDLLVIDEVSMLAWNDFSALVKKMKERGVKILAVGDSGQLPPVKQTAIPFERFAHKAVLRQVVRQSEGSAIISLAWAIRDGQPWHGISGPGIERVSRLGDAFIERVQIPAARLEEERECFIAYRNRRVDEMQNRACDKLYGHRAADFAAGELVLAECNFYAGKTLCCANQDELLVGEAHYDERDATFGLPVMLKNHANGRTFRAYYLSGAELADHGHPYNVLLRELAEKAQRLQAEIKSLHTGDSRRPLVDAQRRDAWKEFFRVKDQTVISFRHPFALTSHKSQGSTYREVFADVADLAKFSQHALYVAVTRPRQTLVVSQ
jgi:exodeoxyribonuclease V